MSSNQAHPQTITETTVSTSTSTVTHSDNPTIVETDVSILTTLLSQLPADSESLDDKDIVELIRQIEAADGVASGLETRLDSIIESLNGLLESLEPADQQVDAAVADVGRTEAEGQQIDGT